MANVNILSSEEIVRKYADMVYRIAKLNTNQESDAEDIFQETFLRLVRHIDNLKDEEHVKAWLIRVTINCCKTKHGSAWNRRAVMTDQETLQQYAQEAATEQEMESREQAEEVYEEVKKLPPKYREVIHLFYFEELSVREISKLLNRQETTVKSQLSRGRAMLREVLKNPWEAT